MGSFLFNGLCELKEIFVLDKLIVHNEKLKVFILKLLIITLYYVCYFGIKYFGILNYDSKSGITRKLPYLSPN